jgi:hypothetical protein
MAALNVQVSLVVLPGELDGPLWSLRSFIIHDRMNSLSARIRLIASPSRLRTRRLDCRAADIQVGSYIENRGGPP